MINNTITPLFKTLIECLKTLEHKSESTVSWFKQNKMIVNTENFRVIT